MFVAAIFFAVLSVASANEFTVTPPANQWVRSGREARLVCSSTRTIYSCAWTTPTGDSYTLEEGHVADGGRIKYVSDNDKECGIVVEDVSEADSGKWKCTVNVLFDGSEIVSRSGVANISIASTPDSVWLAGPFGSGAANVTFGRTKPVHCMVSNATPAPAFTWYIGDEELTGYKTELAETDDGMWTQTLSYSPNAAHANRSLRCVVGHVGLDDMAEAAVLLRFTDGLHATEAEIDQALIVTILVPVLVVCLFGVLFAILVVWCCNKRKMHKGEDVEKVVSEGEAKDGGDKTDSILENGDAEKKDDTSVAKKTGFSERFASFFRFHTKDTSETKEDDVEKAAPEEGDAKEEEKEEAAADKSKTEEKDQEEVDATDAETGEPKQSYSSRIWNFFKLRRRQEGKKEEIKMEDKESDKLQKDEEETEKKQVEYEPEEKEEMKKEEETKAE